MTMSTIIGEFVVINGVAESEAGFEIGLTTNEDGAVPMKSSLMAGNALETGISASVTPDAKVATFESGSDPAVMAAGHASRVVLPNPALLNADTFTPVPQYL